MAPHRHNEIGSPYEATATAGALPSTPLFDDETPFLTMMASFEEAARTLGLSEQEFFILRKSDREVAVSVPVKLDDGSFRIYDGYRIQHNAGLGPFIGPVRIGKDVRLPELRALAAWMTWKCALLGIPFGGAAGGIVLDRDAHSRNELERAVRRWTANLLGDIGPERDILTPEHSADGPIMAWALDTISNHLGVAAMPAVTGKPTELSGSLGYANAVARGLHTILRLASSHHGIDPNDPLRVVVQGAGTVGGNLARMLHAEGHRIVGLADLYSCLASEDGLDVPSLLAHQERNGRLPETAQGAKAVDPLEFIRLPCDVLVPCAVSNAIHSNNATEIQPRLVLEGAHGPVSKRADRILESRGIPVVPDILANGGNVIVSYFEWVQNRSGFAWIGDVVDGRLRRMLREAWNRVRDTQDEHDCSLRMAAHLVAVRAVAEADQARGVYA